MNEVTNKACWVDDAYPSRHVDVDGRIQAYREAGDRETPLMMLLHGIGSGSGSWGYLMDHFKDRYRLIAWDAPGYNISTPLPEDKPGALGYARALGRFLDTIGVRPAVMIGHSLGAMMAGAYAAEVNPDVPVLILGDPANGYGDAASEIREQKLQHRFSALHCCTAVSALRHFDKSRWSARSSMASETPHEKSSLPSH